MNAENIKARKVFFYCGEYNRVIVSMSSGVRVHRQDFWPFDLLAVFGTLGNFLHLPKSHFLHL